MIDIVKICKKHGELTIDQIRMVSNGKQLCKACRQCLNEKSKRSRERDPEKEKLRRQSQYIKHRERDLEYRKEYLANPETKKKVKLTRRAYGIKNKDKLKDKTLRLKFNITIEQYNEMLQLQNNVCAICFEPEKAKVRGADYLKSLAVDHCHISNSIRGLLCDTCNRGLGYFHDSIEKLEKAITYLKKYTN
ncbi:MAG: endonuclease VII domain-containing protein [Bryobacteraceae bacterium]